MSENKNYKIQKTEQRSEDWFAMREGLITGSTAKKAKTSGDAFLWEVLETMTTPTEFEDKFLSKAVEWGVENEPKAREEYEKATGAKVEEVGFIVNGQLGLSPDGVIFSKKNVIRKTIEIKCPETKNHIKHILTNKIPKEHKDQIIHNFIVIDDLEEMDFVSYDPRFNYKPLHIIRVTRESLLLDITTTKIAYAKHLEKLDQNYKKLIL